MVTLSKTKNSLFNKIILTFVLFSFITTSAGINYAHASALAYMPEANSLLTLSAQFTPAKLAGIKFYPDNPLKLDFIIAKGSSTLPDEELKAESLRLIKYFLAALTIPESDLWVNLSPYENKRITEESLSKTELGEDLLGQDYILKQLSASVTYPDSPMGKKFWDKVYKKAGDIYGTTRLPFNTFNKIWIIPDKAHIYEDSDKAVIGESSLKVMMEADYVAMQKATTGNRQEAIGDRQSNEQRTTSDQRQKQTNDLTTQVMKEIVVPLVQEDVNSGKNFANLRQIYNSLLLAMWFKNRLRQAINNRQTGQPANLLTLYIDKKKIKGVETKDPDIKEKIYNQYLETYKKGIYDIIKKEYEPSSKKQIKRRYFSGGLGMDKIPERITKEHFSTFLLMPFKLSSGNYIIKTSLLRINTPNHKETGDKTKITNNDFLSVIEKQAGRNETSSATAEKMLNSKKPLITTGRIERVFGRWEYLLRIQEFERNQPYWRRMSPDIIQKHWIEPTRKAFVALDRDNNIIGYVFGTMENNSFAEYYRNERELHRTFREISILTLPGKQRKKIEKALRRKMIEEIRGKYNYYAFIQGHTFDKPMVEKIWHSNYSRKDSLFEVTELKRPIAEDYVVIKLSSSPVAPNFTEGDLTINQSTDYPFTQAYTFPQCPDAKSIDSLEGLINIFDKKIYICRLARKNNELAIEIDINKDVPKTAHEDVCNFIQETLYGLMVKEQPGGIFEMNNEDDIHIEYMVNLKDSIQKKYEELLSKIYGNLWLSKKAISAENANIREGERQLKKGLYLKLPQDDKNTAVLSLGILKNRIDKLIIALKELPLALNKSCEFLESEFTGLRTPEKLLETIMANNFDIPKRGTALESLNALFRSRDFGRELLKRSKNNQFTPAAKELADSIAKLWYKEQLANSPEQAPLGFKPELFNLNPVNPIEAGLIHINTANIRMLMEAAWPGETPDIKSRKNPETSIKEKSNEVYKWLIDRNNIKIPLSLIRNALIDFDLNGALLSKIFWGENLQKNNTLKYSPESLKDKEKYIDIYSIVRILSQEKFPEHFSLISNSFEKRLVKASRMIGETLAAKRIPITSVNTSGNNAVFLADIPGAIETINWSSGTNIAPQIFNGNNNTSLEISSDGNNTLKFTEKNGDSMAIVELNIKDIGGNTLILDMHAPGRAGKTLKTGERVIYRENSPNESVKLPALGISRIKTNVYRGSHRVNLEIETTRNPGAYYREIKDTKKFLEGINHNSFSYNVKIIQASSSARKNIPYPDIIKIPNSSFIIPTVSYIDSSQAGRFEELKNSIQPGNMKMLFDVGNVCMPVNWQKVAEAIESDYGVEKAKFFEYIERRYIDANNWQGLYEIGRINTTQTVERLNEWIKENTSRNTVKPMDKKTFIKLWLTVLPEVIKETLELMIELKAKEHRIKILSASMPLQYPVFKAVFKDVVNENDMITSFKRKIDKKDPATYSGIDADIFIDDLEENLLAANAGGIPNTERFDTRKGHTLESYERIINLVNAGKKRAAHRPGSSSVNGKASLLNVNDFEKGGPRTWVKLNFDKTLKERIDDFFYILDKEQEYYFLNLKDGKELTYRKYKIDNQNKESFLAYAGAIGAGREFIEEIRQDSSLYYDVFETFGNPAGVVNNLADVDAANRMRGKLKTISIVNSGYSLSVKLANAKTADISITTTQKQEALVKAAEWFSSQEHLSEFIGMEITHTMDINSIINTNFSNKFMTRIIILDMIERCFRQPGADQVMQLGETGLYTVSLRAKLQENGLNVFYDIQNTINAKNNHQNSEIIILDGASSSAVAVNYASITAKSKNSSTIKENGINGGIDLKTNTINLEITKYKSYNNKTTPLSDKTKFPPSDNKPETNTIKSSSAPTDDNRGNLIGFSIKILSIKEAANIKAAFGMTRDKPG